MKKSIVIAEDDKDMQHLLSSLLEDEGYEVTASDNGYTAFEVIKKNIPDLVLLDIKLPGLNGMKVLEKIIAFDKNILTIMITAYVDVNDAVKAMKLGAYDYLTKPFDFEELILIIKKAFHIQNLSREVEILKIQLDEKTESERLMGESPQIKKIITQVNLIAPTNMSVVIQGKSGTGKEVIANMIHQKSERKDKPLIPIDCGAIPDTLIESELFGYERGAFTGAEKRKEGYFSIANGGTLFLDEITNLPLTAQAKLLRVIQEKKFLRIGGANYINVDVRILCATNRNIAELVNEGKFRDDLYYRLNEFQISLPLLCERQNDILVLTKKFINEANNELKRKIRDISPEALKLFLNYAWPGNVRELKNVVKKAVLLSESDTILPEHLSLEIIKFHDEIHLPKHIKGNASLEDIVIKFEQEIILKAIEQADGNKTKAADILGINIRTLHRKIKDMDVLE